MHTFPPEVKEAFAKLDTATTAVGTTIKALRDRIAVGMSQETVDELQAELTKAADKLIGYAADPENPVPEPPPAPAPVE